ncbi:MAG: AEC family transporter [Pseudomonadota bacterium]
MHTVFTVALPVFGVVAAGILAGRLNILTADDSTVLNKFIYRAAMPAALFGLTAGAAPPEGADLSIAATYMIAAIIVLFSAYFFAQMFHGLARQPAGAHAFGSVFGNAVFLGLPIALSIDGWIRPYAILILAEGVVVVALGLILYAPSDGATSLGGRIVRGLSGAVRNPLLIAAAAGFGLSALRVDLAAPIENFFGILGRAAGPTALFSLGLFLGTQALSNISQFAGRATTIAMAKLGLMPLIALSIAPVLGVPDGDYFGALALFVFVPTAVGAFVIAEQNGVYRTETAAAISLTSLLSLGTISTVLFLFA